MNSPSNQSEENSFVNGTSDREAHPKYWIAVLVQMCTEQKVSTRLNKLGITNYVPTQTEIHQWSDRKKKIERIVIPMVVFVQVDKEIEKSLKTYSFIYKFISYPGQKETAIIPDEQILNLKYILENSSTEVFFTNHLKVGDVVKIARGPLKGFEGIISIIDNRTQVLAIRIDCLGYACVKISKEFL